MSNNLTDPFLITSPLGITSVLQALATQKTLVHMHLEQRSKAIITTVLDVDMEQKYFVVDAAADDTFNQRLAKADQIHFDAVVDKIRVQFSSGPAQAITFDQRQAFRLAYPGTLRRLQRRDHFRIDIPVSMPLFCDVPVKGRAPLTLAVKDISAGGIALLDPDHSITDDTGTRLAQCVLELDDVGTVVTTLIIRRIHDQAQGTAKPVRVVACEFDHPQTSNNIMLQNYIGRLDRLLNARRRGFD